jgi:pimeloyl-ACP methyl ester carboxylesterase
LAQRLLPASAAAHRSVAARSSYASVNGLRIYYEVHGRGRPLILLHGGLGSTELLGGVLPALASTRRVIAPDLQAHGRTSDIDRPLSFEAMADDLAGLMRYLGIPQAK